MGLRICSISAEAVPLAKTGGLGDAVSALGHALRAAGHDLRLFLPAYARIDRAASQPLSGHQDLPLQLGPHHYRWGLRQMQLPGSNTPVLLIDCPALYAREGIYSSEPDEHLRFLLLTHAALQACRRLRFAPHIVHCHDWHAAFAPLLLKTIYHDDPVLGTARSVLTIHNIGHQGSFAATAVADVGLGPWPGLLHQDDLHAGLVNPLKHGVMYADAITTVSPSYAREICTPEFGFGLDGLLRQRSDRLVGILNGVDYRIWDPRKDAYLPERYGPGRLAGKARIKQAFIKRTRMSLDPRTPLAGIVSRFSPQKGLELLYESLPPLLARGALGLAVLGSGSSDYEGFFEALQREFPGRVMFHCGYSEEIAHWIEAASDLFIMPSRYEPCGLNQMYSLRYGTVPVVRRTGGLADTVQLYDPDSGEGTGIVFEHFDANAMRWALETAVALYAQPRHWQRMQANGMRQDFSWKRQARIYAALYRQLLAESQP